MEGKSVELLQDSREEYLHEIGVTTDVLNKTHTALPKRKKSVSWTLLKIRTLYQKTVFREGKRKSGRRYLKYIMSTSYPKHIKNFYKPVRNRQPNFKKTKDLSTHVTRGFQMTS